MAICHPMREAPEATVGDRMLTMGSTEGRAQPNHRLVFPAIRATCERSEAPRTDLQDSSILTQ